MTRDFISTIILAMKSRNLTINSLCSSQGNFPYLASSNWPLTSNDLFFSNPINGLDLDSTSSIYQIFDRPEGQVLVCDICSQEFNDPKSIKQHKREAHRYQCDQCASNYTGNEHYFIHGKLLGLLTYNKRTQGYTDRLIRILAVTDVWVPERTFVSGGTYISFFRTNTFVEYPRNTLFSL